MEVLVQASFLQVLDKLEFHKCLAVSDVLLHDGRGVTLVPRYLLGVCLVGRGNTPKVLLRLKCLIFVWNEFAPLISSQKVWVLLFRLSLQLA